MDFINDTIERNEVAISKGSLQAMSRIVEKPHGLFYRISNVSIDSETTTLLDWIYDENISTTEESFYTEMSTSDYENVTDVTLFNKTSKPKILPKKSERCGCDLLYKICDINCCCDSDCTDAEKMLFAQNCEEICLEEQFMCGSCQMKDANFLENLFCISKTNLPDKRLTDIQFDEAEIDRFPRWRSGDKGEFHNFSIYKYNDPIWLTNETMFYADIPMPVANYYCSDKRPIRFLRNEEINCIVKLQDLHMFQAIKYMDSKVLSMETFNNTMSEIRTNWTLLICDKQCREYNKTRDEPHCTDIYCDRIATTVQYIFNYNARITNATIKLYVKKVSMKLPFIMQNIQVKFYLTNDSTEIFKFSGNPGYNFGLPIIVSSAENNHSVNFFKSKRFLTYPDNNNGNCNSYKILLFGHNKRSKCRFYIQQINLKNATTACNFIQKQIFNLLGLNSTLYISPYGNPEVSEQWLRMQIKTTNIFGAFKNKELTCSNLIVRIGYVMAFDSWENKILYGDVEGTAQNITFDTEDISTVLTVDTSFIDLRKSTRININLPFLPNKGNIREVFPFIALTIINVLY